MKVLRHGKVIEMTNKTVWDGDAFAELAARIKDVEGRLREIDKFIAPVIRVANEPPDFTPTQESAIRADRLHAIERINARLDKLERPWVEARAQRQREIDAGKAAGQLLAEPGWLADKLRQAQGQTAGDRGKNGLNASITDLLEEIVRLEQSREELRLHVKAREGEIERLRAANNQMLERLRAGAANFEKMLG